MNLSPSAVLVILVVAAVINLLIFLAWTIRVRADRSRRLAEVGGYMSSSYDDGAAPGARRGDDERRLAAAEGWPTSTGPWADPSDWPMASWPASDAVMALRSKPTQPIETVAEPFEYPEPTSLEQRSAAVEESAEGDASAEDEADDVDSIADDLDDEDDDGEYDDGDVDDDDAEDEVMETTEIVAADEDANQAAAAEMPSSDDSAEPAEVPQTLGEIAANRAPSAPRGHDMLTGLLDAMAFQDVLSHEEAREQRYGRAATVIVFELDGLVRLVDRLGAEVGDRIETALGDTIRRLARRADHVARLERGRYAVLLPETDEVAAINYVERIRRACDLWLESGAIAMRLAIGWASTGGDTGLSGAIRLATERMRLELRRSARQADDGDGDQPAEAGAA